MYDNYLWDKVTIHVNDAPLPGFEHVQTAQFIKKFFYRNSNENTVTLLFEYPKKWILIANTEYGTCKAWAELKAESVPDEHSSKKPSELHILQSANALIKAIYEYDIRIRKDIVEDYYKQVAWPGWKSGGNFLDKQYTKLLYHIERLYVLKKQYYQFGLSSFREEDNFKPSEKRKQDEEKVIAREVMYHELDLEEYLG